MGCGGSKQAVGPSGGATPDKPDAAERTVESGTMKRGQSKLQPFQSKPRMAADGSIIPASVNVGSTQKRGSVTVAHGLSFTEVSLLQKRLRALASPCWLVVCSLRARVSERCARSTQSRLPVTVAAAMPPRMRCRGWWHCCRFPCLTARLCWIACTVRRCWFVNCRCCRCCRRRRVCAAAAC